MLEKEHRYTQTDFGSMIKCQSCGSEMKVRYSRKNKGYFLGCKTYPSCLNTEQIDVVKSLEQLRIAILYLHDIIEISKEPEFQRADYRAIENFTELIDEVEDFFFMPKR